MNGVSSLLHGMALTVALWLVLFVCYVLIRYLSEKTPSSVSSGTGRWIPSLFEILEGILLLALVAISLFMVVHIYNLLILILVSAGIIHWYAMAFDRLESAYL